MIVYKEVEVPAKPAEVVCQEDHRLCELCGNKIVSRNRFDVDEATIELRSGSSYPGENFIDRTEIDICGPCFRSKLIPWVKSQGGEPREIPWF